MNPSFLRIEKDQNAEIWCVSPVAALNPGFGFLIVCDSKNKAESVVAMIGNGQLNYPTVSSRGFVEVTGMYPLLKNMVKVFAPL